MFYLFFFYSCNQDDNLSEYPKTFVFHDSNIINEKAFVFGDNESYVEINSKTGNLEAFGTEVANDLYGHIRNLAVGYYVESIEFLTEDTIRLNIWEDGIVKLYTLPVEIENEDIKIKDTSFYISKLNWDKVKQEIKFCLTLSLGILERNRILIPEFGYNYCESGDINMEFQNILSDFEFEKNDTLGVYLLDMIYKE